MKIRAVLDTNLWISYLIGGRLDELDRLFVRNDLVLLFSPELLREFVAVASRVKFIKYFSQVDLGKLLDRFNRFGEIVDPNISFSLCRDPKDNFLLSLAVSGHADYLVTGDGDLLELNTIGDTAITTAAEFLSILGQ